MTRLGPRRPDRTRQTDDRPSRVRPTGSHVAVRSSETIDRGDGWSLRIRVLERADDAVCVALMTSNGDGGGSRVQIGRAELDAVQRALDTLRAMLATAKASR